MYAARGDRPTGLLFSQSVSQSVSELEYDQRGLVFWPGEVRGRAIDAGA